MSWCFLYFYYSYYLLFRIIFICVCMFHLFIFYSYSNCCVSLYFLFWLLLFHWVYIYILIVCFFILRKPFKPILSDLVYADVVEGNDYGPTNYKGASVLQASEKNKANNADPKSPARPPRETRLWIHCCLNKTKNMTYFEIGCPAILFCFAFPLLS